MKIVYFSWEFPPKIVGGLGTFTMEITQELVKMGNAVTVFTLCEDENIPTVDNWNGVEVHRPKILDFSSMFSLLADYNLRAWGEHIKFFSDVIAYNMLSATKLVNQLISKDNREFDIIDAHDWLGIFGAVGAKKRLNLPLIFHVHSTEKGRCMGKGSRVIEEFEYKGGEEADCIITVSKAMENELRRLGFPRNKIRVCWNGVNAKKYNPDNVSIKKRQKIRKEYGITEDETMLLFIGRLVTVKGVQNLIESMPEVLNEFPKTKLVVLGKGDLEEDLKNRVKNHNLHNNVLFRTEFAPEDERIAHYAASDIVTLPSLYEPFGIVCTEALSMKKPVIVGAKDTSGMREQVIPNGDQQCGVHINPFDIHDISWGIKTLLGAKEKLAEMGENGRKRVLENFTWPIIAKKTYDIYTEFVKGH